MDHRLHEAEIRWATPDEANSLTELAVRSKAHWGYDDEFMTKARPALEVSTDYIRNWPVFVLTIGADLIGFAGFVASDAEVRATDAAVDVGDIFLNDLFVEPAWIGTGAGTKLWDHAVGVARSRQWSSFLIESEPFAEAFYLSKGATRVGGIKSIATGRTLPLLRFTTHPTSAVT